VHKGLTQTNKRSNLGFKSKGAKKPKVSWSGAPDSVRCTRTVQLRTLHLRVSEAALRYNSPDYPVYQAEQRLPAQRSTATDTCERSTATDTCEQCSQKSEQPLEAHRTVNSVCPVPLEDKAPTVKSARTLTVG
jgi:hypothetical protein